VRIPAIPASISDFESIEACVQLSVDGETTVTHQINDLVALASSQSNHVALRFLDFFVVEQLEEVNKMTDLLIMVQRAGSQGLLLVEDYLSKQGGEVTASE